MVNEGTFKAIKALYKTKLTDRIQIEIGEIFRNAIGRGSFHRAIASDFR